MDAQDRANLLAMKACIDQIENLAAEIGELGRGVAVVEKNVRLILETIHVLKFGISDPAELLIR